MKVAVTGAGGFLGQVLVSRLKRSNHEPLAIVRKNTDISIFKERGIAWVQCDLSDPNPKEDDLKGCDALVHCAAYTRQHGRWEDFKRINIDLTHNIMDFSLRAGLKKVIHISTTSVCGNERNHYGTDEEVEYGERIVDHYTRSKIEAEKVVANFIDRYDLPAIILRPGYIWGPGDQTLIPFIVNGLKSNRLRLVDDGDNILSLTFIYNVIEAIMKSLALVDVPGRIYTITDGSKIKSKRFIGDIINLLGIDYKLTNIRYPLLYTSAYFKELFQSIMPGQRPVLTRFAARFLKYNAIFDISKAIYELGYQPKVNYQQGMAMITPYIRSLYYGFR